MCGKLKCFFPLFLLLPSVFPPQVGQDNVHTALSLVGYEADLRKAMEYVFGSTLVCDTLENAKCVAFDKRVMTKTVTLGGDVFDPQGTLSGGERAGRMCERTCADTLRVNSYGYG